MTVLSSSKATTRNPVEAMKEMHNGATVTATALRDGSTVYILHLN